VHEVRVMTGRCIKCHGTVADRDLMPVGEDEAGSGPGRPARACLPCVREHGLVPLTGAALIGRRTNAAPILPGSAS
jgi:hypothetical protein